MYPAAPRDIHDTQLGQDPVGGPQPVGGDAVHHGVYQGEKAVSVEIAPVENRKAFLLLFISLKRMYCT